MAYFSYSIREGLKPFVAQGVSIEVVYLFIFYSLDEVYDNHVVPP